MKKKIKETMLGLLGVIVMFGGLLAGGYIENHYSMDATVDYYKGELCFIDSMGEAWSDDRVEEFEVGDTVRITYYTNTTDNTRYDDEVQKVAKK